MYGLKGAADAVHWQNKQQQKKYFLLKKIYIYTRYTKNVEMLKAQVFELKKKKKKKKTELK